MSTTVRVWLVGLAGLLGAVPAWASVIPLSLTELADRCEHAVVGDTLSVQAEWNKEGTQLSLVVQVWGDIYFTGNVTDPSAVLILIEPAVADGEAAVLVEGSPSFAVGESVLVFTERVVARLGTVARFPASDGGCGS